MDRTSWLIEVVTKPEFGLVFALILTFVMYAVFRRKDELGKHAAENTSATLVVCGANIVAGLLFLEEVDGFFQSVYGALRIPTLNPAIWDGVPFWVAAIVGLAAKDFADYWNHRMMHTRWGWPTHAAHHSDTFVNAFTGFRVHFLEAITMSLSYVVLLTWLRIPETIPVVVIFSTLHGQYVHMNLNITHGPFKYLVAWPQFHRWHHADVPAAYGKNLANLMPLWDKLFGTYYYPGPCGDEVPMGALRDGLADKDPVAIYLYPFQEWRRLIRKAWGGRGRASDKPAAPVHPAE